MLTTLHSNSWCSLWLSAEDREEGETISSGEEEEIVLALLVLLFWFNILPPHTLMDPVICEEKSGMIPGLVSGICYRDPTVTNKTRRKSQLVVGDSMAWGTIIFWGGCVYKGSDRKPWITCLGFALLQEYEEGTSTSDL